MSTESAAPPHDSEPAPSRLRFAGFEADLRSRELFRDGERIPLQGRPFEVLAALLERPGEVVLRQELQDRLWPGQIVEFDNNLNTALTKLRRALDDTSADPAVIETLPRRGYRLLVPVEPAAAPPARPAARPGGRFATWLGVAVAVTAVAIAAFLVARQEPVRPAPASAARGGTSAVGVPERTSLLVVLPFASLDGDDAGQRLADTLTEELINRLAELLPPELGVIARTSAMSFAGASVDVAAVRTTLGVDFVLEGSLARDGQRLRVNARFVHAADQAHLWAESHEAPLDEIPRIQRALAERIAATVSPQHRPRASLVAERSAAPEAWAAYLQARFILTSTPSPSEEAIAGAVGLLRRTVELAPDFALAWSALADAIAHQGGPAAARHAEARQAAERARDLDPGLARPHHRLAHLALYQDWDWQRAKREFDLALSLAPNLAVVHHSLAAWYSTQGRHDEAIESIERALVLDPLSVVLHADAGWYLFVARRYEEAVERCHQAIELVPTHLGANSYLFHSLIALGRTEEAAAAARTLLEIESAGPERRQRATASPQAAIEELRRHRLERLMADHARGAASPGRLALAHLALGDTDDALTFLEEGLAERWGWIYPFLSVYPLLDPLADHPRFRRMVEQVGIP